MLSRRALTGFAVAVIAAVVAAVAVTDAPKAASRPPAYHVYHQFWCGNPGHTLRYTFWPKGNLGPGTPSEFPDATYLRGIPAPDRTLPHLNAYRKGTSWADPQWLVFIGQPSTAPGPKNNGEASVGYRREGGRPCQGPLPGNSYDDPHNGTTVLKRSSTATALRCRFTSKFAYVGWGGSWNHRTAAVYQRNKSNQRHRPMLIRATLGAKHPIVTWNTAFCRRIPLPR